jgi:hypothetical protein
VSGVLRWETPPEAINGRKAGNPPIPWALIADQLRARPGEWGVVYDGSHAPHIMQRINAGTPHWFAPRGAFEATSRAQPSGTTAYYVRYIGSPP